MSTAPQEVIDNVQRVIVGKEDAVKSVAATLIAGGHALINDVPGVGKTTLARAFAKSLDLSFARIQFTPDLLPSDVTGVTVYDQDSGSFAFHKGPVFVNVLLADEINRTPPRTQSALLEAMNENQVTIDGKRHPLPSPFIVVATQNPVETAGTYPLPTGELDRFMAAVSIGYPDQEEERELLLARKLADPLDGLEVVAPIDDILAWQEQVRKIEVSRVIMDYILALLRVTRSHKGLKMGASPRAGLHLFRYSQALAFLEGRDYVLPDDVKGAALPVLRHRLETRTRTGLPGRGAGSVLEEILRDVPVPA